eukprot:3094846-Pyramimonas_sp.AAC.1
MIRISQVLFTSAVGILYVTRAVGEQASWPHRHRFRIMRGVRLKHLELCELAAQTPIQNHEVRSAEASRALTRVCYSS